MHPTSALLAKRTVPNTRVKDTSLPEGPWVMPASEYSGLMGLLATHGTLWVGSSQPYKFPDQSRLRFSHTDQSFLEFIKAHFAPWLEYWQGITLDNTSTNPRFRLHTINNPYVDYLHSEWVDNGQLILPWHFETFFTWKTLAFWAMRTGKLDSTSLHLSVVTLCMEDKLRLLALIQGLGLVAKLSKDGNYIAIRNFSAWQHNMIPHFHESVLYRVTVKAKDTAKYRQANNLRHKKS